MPTKKNCLTLKFNEISKNDIGIAGGKGANLGEMIKANIPVPNGFVVTSYAYFQFIRSTGLDQFIKKELKNFDVENSKKLQQVAIKIQKAIKKENLPKELINEIKDQYKLLSGKSDALVAVRSSATAEDLPDASFAGQQETYLNIKGGSDVIKATQDCFASLFGARAIYYRQKQGFDHFKVGIAVPIQLMIQSEVSGIVFTINPLTNNRKEISIEAAYGLGQPIVSGEITPDQYIVNKKKYEIIEKNVVSQDWQLTQKGRIKISRDYKKKQKLSDKYIIELAKICQRLEDHYNHPQDIEWGYMNKKIYIVQTRPVTTIKKESKVDNQVKDYNIPHSDILLSGLAASPGYTSGKVKIIHTAKEINKIKQGDILVTEMTDPDFVPAMRRANAILTDLGGRTSHAAIVSRELGIPAIVGSKMATSILKNNEIITINGFNGEVYSGDYVDHLKSIKPEETYSEYRNKKTATKVYVNLGEPHLATEVSKMGVDGVGLLRAEFMIAQIGEHPRKFIEKKKQKVFINKLAEGLETFASQFHPRPIIYRATDFKTNEYKNLKGGNKYEQEEENPLIGFRGVTRYLEDAKVFEMEIKAINIVRNKKGYKNLHLMLPFVRTVNQLKEVKKLMSSFDLKRNRGFELYLMVEIPSNVIMLQEFINVGIDGISIGSNDLTMLILGVDRDNPRVANVFDERDPAVQWALETAISIAKKNNIKSSICGQAPTTYPDLIKNLVRWGITSVSVSPDTAYLARKMITEAEFDIARKKK